MRPALCEEALRQGRVLSGLAPQEAEVHGLVALMEIQASRSRARVGANGEPILLLEQDRSRWDQLLIRRGLKALAKAESLRVTLGPYTLQATIAACHAQARRADQTDWPRIAALYGGARAGPALANRRVESCRGAGHGAGAFRGPGSRRPSAIRASATALPPVAECARRSARETRTLRGSVYRVRTSGRAHTQCARALAAAGARACCATPDAL